MIVTHKLQSMDLTHKQNTSRVDVVQDEKYSRNLEFTFTVNGSPWEIPEGTTAIVRYKKPDGTGGNYDALPDGSVAYQINGNVLTVALAPQVCTVSGTVQLSVGLIQGTAEINTFSVNIAVQPNPGAKYQSEDYIKLSGAVPNSGWTPNMYLGTDESGNVVAKEGTSGGGGTVSVDSTLTKPGQAADAKAVGDAIAGIELPEKLPNPYALTFTGAVTGSYDGSAPLEVAIPSGGDAVKRVRHIATVSVTAGTTSYSVTVDSNGDSLNLESVYILTEKFWCDNGSYVQVDVNGKTITKAFGQSGSPQVLELEKMGELQKFTNIPKPSDVRISFGDYYNGKSAVTSVGFWSAISTVNTTIEIYGVDA